MATKKATKPATKLPHVNDFILQGDWLIADATYLNEDGTHYYLQPKTLTHIILYSIMEQDPYTTALYYNEIVSDIISTYNEYN